MPAHTIYIAITGKQATGKMSLAARLNDKVYFSHGHGFEFRFSVVDGKSQFANMLLIIFDASTPTSYPGELLYKAYIRKQSLCVVGTKSDLLIQEDCHPELTNREYSCRFGYYYDVDYVLVSNMRGDGIEDLMGTIVCNLYPVPPLKRTFVERLSSGAGSLISSILDGIIALFVLPHPRQQQDIPVVPLIESDDEVIHLMDSSAVKDWDKSLLQRLNAGGSDQGVPSHLITPFLIAKDATSSE
ncbi:uncharacterized protein LAESUDRAFT_553473 [Laetiporus sulphureus 93-53]|uniref:P-loop containing nucleoside triphosphate hydrolase protein n=1 Tax=Laetiporus sulphureus 93-53 TaxID=1314785 RepID=A0A165B8X1_9APHY|nr:uncharacterized protein LAESUDRAFT_553473 [Laetiporus sulphureus 93-53]KZT00513.1 hypothetical protein LAESUDRAFT_553473 [Laetiporus sulphureus 93-53]